MHVPEHFAESDSAALRDTVGWIGVGHRVTVRPDMRAASIPVARDCRPGGVMCRRLRGEVERPAAVLSSDS